MNARHAAAPGAEPGRLMRPPPPRVPPTVDEIVASCLEALERLRAAMGSDE